MSRTRTHPRWLGLLLVFVLAGGLLADRADAHHGPDLFPEPPESIVRLHSYSGTAPDKEWFEIRTGLSQDHIEAGESVDFYYARLHGRESEPAAAHCENFVSIGELFPGTGPYSLTVAFEPFTVSFPTGWEAERVTVPAEVWIGSGQSRTALNCDPPVAWHFENVTVAFGTLFTDSLDPGCYYLGSTTTLLDPITSEGGSWALLSVGEADCSEFDLEGSPDDPAPPDEECADEIAELSGARGVEAHQQVIVREWEAQVSKFQEELRSGPSSDPLDKVQSAHGLVIAQKILNLERQVLINAQRWVRDAEQALAECLELAGEEP